ncbi:MULTISPECIES: peptidoglycan D,D-transpeptidase FtsI family protein [Gordonia]|uniref:Penicillin-binding protein 2 n=1 Tax=Gordonia amicalis TaxID=89053 RepID=A0AAE4R9C1_9ACTN|nr:MULTISPECIES: penicillin-binding protein 2 [Gordonia]ATD71411.1 penicillin-binding protein 2 [Gordonia sp. 1D]MCR8896404.1 penicillin-binding protein 2 [Gordonia sp. GONU]MCZ0913698.1 penicillin-binding protein 2 [Gordonia amicalis]MCZ4580200.1 penicillin-binding protein 2 [Gordonia amicalis]MDJ0452224.1 penicillin-binding protein 2 [Gordonia amicalis]
MTRATFERLGHGPSRPGRRPGHGPSGPGPRPGHGPSGPGLRPGRGSSAAGGPRGRGPGKGGPRKGGGLHSFGFRTRVAGVVVLLVVLAVAAKMIVVHTVQAGSISAEAAQQREYTQVLTAKRGSILDRNGRPLAYTDEARSLTFLPKAVRKSIEEEHRKNAELPGVDERLKEIAKGVSVALGGSISEEDLLGKVTGDEPFVYLARAVSPDVAKRITEEFPEVGADPESIRLYPGGSLAANVIGDVNYDGNGLIGLEASLDAILSGSDGSRTYDRGSDGAIIPGSTRNVHPAINGSTVRLTLDSDTQWFVQSQVIKAKQASGARAASAVVLDAKTGEVLAMANDGTFNASLPLSDQPKAELGNPSVTSPFEPGSVNKLVAASAAIEYGLTRPDTVHQVPGSIQMSGVTVRDAWPHGVEPYTTTGIFGKSSNVGTLMLAKRIGEERFADMLKRFGLGQRTGVGLPAESAGEVPALSQWSGGSFANLPIGQGLSMTLLQMTAMYQAIANDGLRVPPRILVSEERDGSTREGRARPEPVRVVSEQTARTVRDMFRSVVQDDPMGVQMGTGTKAAVSGYQVSGKTGTAQQVDPSCGCYSNSRYNITFAGIAPADAPRYVIGIMLDNPRRSSDGSGGQSAGPLFSTIASWMLQRAQVPLSAPAPRLTLTAN